MLLAANISTALTILAHVIHWTTGHLPGLFGIPQDLIKKDIIGDLFFIQRCPLFRGFYNTFGSWINIEGVFDLEEFHCITINKPNC